METLASIKRCVELDARWFEPAKAALVKLRYFAGMTIPQAAEALGIAPSTADRHWAYARAWLHAELSRGDPAD